MQTVITLVKHIKFIDQFLKTQDLKRRVKEREREEFFNALVRRNLVDRQRLYQSLEGKACHYCKGIAEDVCAAIPTRHQDGKPRQYKPVCAGCLSWHHTIHR